MEGIVNYGMKLEVPAPMVDLRITGYRNYTIAYELLYNSVTGEFEVGNIL